MTAVCHSGEGGISTKTNIFNLKPKKLTPKNTISITDFSFSRVFDPKKPIFTPKNKVVETLIFRSKMPNKAKKRQKCPIHSQKRVFHFLLAIFCINQYLFN